MIMDLKKAPMKSGGTINSQNLGTVRVLLHWVAVIVEVQKAAAAAAAAAAAVEVAAETAAGILPWMKFCSIGYFVKNLIA